MQFRQLGRSDLQVSTVCLGTMPFGSQVDQRTSIGLLDRAFDGGINFIDTAEMYASPPSAQTYGKSEQIVGKWLRRKPRESVIVATKIAGPNDMPELEAVMYSVPNGANNVGAVGLGEPPSVAAPAAVANAVANAVGVPVRSLPITPDKVLVALSKRGV